MNRSHRKKLPQHKELVQEREEVVEQREEAVKKGDEVVEEREVATVWENAVKTQEGALQEEKVMKKLNQQRIRASAAGSSSPSRQPPPPGPATHIHQLPDEVLWMIFAPLNLKTITKVLSVCRRWQGVVIDWYLNKGLKFENSTCTTQEALCLIHSALNLKSLELCRRSDTVALLDAASARCSKLLHLSVEFWMASVSFRKVFQTNPHISHLILRYGSTADGLQLYQELGTLLPDLRKLELEIYILADLELDALIDSCARNQMEEFTAPFNHCSEEHVAKMVKFWGRSLRVLELSAAWLMDAALALLAGCSELRQLKLYELSTCGDGLCGLAALSHLEELCLSGEIGLTSENWCSFLSLSNSSHGLRKLSVKSSGVDDRVLTSVAAFCPQLEELDVAYTNVTICGVREVLRCCRKLQYLDMDLFDVRVADIVPELPQLAPQLCRIRIAIHAKHALGEATLRRVQAQMPHLTIE